MGYLRWYFGFLILYASKRLACTALAVLYSIEQSNGERRDVSGDGWPVPACRRGVAGRPCGDARVADADAGLCDRSATPWRTVYVRRVSVHGSVVIEYSEPASGIERRAEIRPNDRPIHRGRPHSHSLQKTAVWTARRFVVHFLVDVARHCTWL